MIDVSNVCIPVTIEIFTIIIFFLVASGREHDKVFGWWIQQTCPCYTGDPIQGSSLWSSTWLSPVSCEVSIFHWIRGIREEIKFLLFMRPFFSHQIIILLFLWPVRFCLMRAIEIAQNKDVFGMTCYVFDSDERFIWSQYIPRTTISVWSLYKTVEVWPWLLQA